MPVLSVAQESAGLTLPCCLCFFEADCPGRNVNLKRVVSSLRLGDLVCMNHARRNCDSNSDGFNVSYAFVKRSVRFGISYGLIKQVSEVIKQCVLLLNF